MKQKLKDMLLAPLFVSLLFGAVHFLAMCAEANVKGLQNAIKITHSFADVTTDAEILPAGFRSVGWVQNIGANDCYLAHSPDADGTAVAAADQTGILIPASGGVYEFERGGWVTHQSIRAVCPGGSSRLLIAIGS